MSYLYRQFQIYPSYCIVIKKGEETIKEIEVKERFVAGDLDIEVESGEGYSYQLVIVSNADATANGTTQISKVALYGEGQGKPAGITEMYRINSESGVRYNLSGKRVHDSYKGIVILNGKKMLQK